MLNAYLLTNFIKIGVLVGCVVGLMFALSIYQRKRRPHPEWVRKLMHLGAGLITLSLPWIFDENWPVIVLSVLAAGGMFAITSLRALRRLGAVTGNVLRRTLGEICFPLGAGVVFVLADGDRLLYSIPILILTFADASAALIGVFYGMRHYTTSDGRKTLEGSAAFFLTAFLCTLIPLLLFTHAIGRLEMLLIALLMALLAMLLDAVAWWGLDNLLIPVLSFLLLREFLPLSINVLMIQLVVTLVMILGVMFWRKRTTLNDSAILVTVIYGYLCWNLADWRWMIPPLLLLVSYNFLSPPDVAPSERPYTVQVVLSVGAAGLFWLILNNITGSQTFYFPFMLSFSAQLAMIGSSRHLRAAKQISLIRLLSRSVVVGWLLLFIPFALLVSTPRVLWLDGLAALVAVTIGVLAFTLTQAGADGYRNTPQRWLLQSLSAGLASLLGLAAVQMI